MRDDTGLPGEEVVQAHALSIPSGRVRRSRFGELMAMINTRGLTAAFLRSYNRRR
jgi:hypothetical protein